MSELVKKIIDYFENKAISIYKKMTMLIFVIILLLFVDNCCGFSYYFVQSYKLNYITSLEDARVKYGKDRVVSQELDNMMVNALNRWTAYNAVSDIFQNTFSTTTEARERKMIEEITKNGKGETEIKNEKKEDKHDLLSKFFPVAERSPFWHTVCSCLLLISFLLICVIYLIFSPFINDANKKKAMLGMCIIIPFMIGAIFFTQWIVSFIPNIDGRPRINYCLYSILNILLLIFSIKKMSKK